MKPCSLKRFIVKNISTRSRLTCILTFAALISCVGLLIATWLNFDEEDFFPDNDPWPGTVYSSPGLSRFSKNADNKPVVTLAVVACKNRIAEAMTMLKSAVIFSKNIHLHVIAVTDKGSQEILANEMAQLKKDADRIKMDIEFEVYRSWFPKHGHRTWRKLWLPCSAQRLFFPSMFKHVDSLLYIDSDTYFVSDVGHVWRYFRQMGPAHLAAMSAEHELPGDGWYNKKSKIPYYGLRGLNAGVILMNLTRMREKNVEETVRAVLENYKDKIYWGDQDILNIVFHFFPDYLYKLKCEYNFRAQHCKCDYPGRTCACNSAADTGVAIIHGNRRRFQYFSDKSLEFFRDFYNHFHAYKLRSNNLAELYASLKESYDRVEEQPCGMTGQVLLSRFEAYLQ